MAMIHAWWISSTICLRPSDRRMRVYTQHLTAAEVSHNTLVQDGVIRNIEILGEAARNIERAYPEFARQHPEVPWALVYAMRNRVAHGYFTVDLEIVWRTIHNDFPDLEQHIKSMRENQ